MHPVSTFRWSDVGYRQVGRFNSLVGRSCQGRRPQQGPSDLSGICFFVLEVHRSKLTRGEGRLVRNLRTGVKVK
jgi:hypothetical protein